MQNNLELDQYRWFIWELDKWQKSLSMANWRVKVRISNFIEYVGAKNLSFDHLLHLFNKNLISEPKALNEGDTPFIIDDVLSDLQTPQIIAWAYLKDFAESKVKQFNKYEKTYI